MYLHCYITSKKRYIPLTHCMQNVPYCCCTLIQSDNQLETRRAVFTSKSAVVIEKALIYLTVAYSKVYRNVLLKAKKSRPGSTGSNESVKGWYRLVVRGYLRIKRTF